MTGTWRGLVLDPHDPLFFRDGKPSTIGADHYLRSVFPPFPSTVYGAIRARRLMDHAVPLDRLDRSRWESLPETLRAELGEWGGLGTLHLRGPWLVRRDRDAAGGWQVLLPAPHDLGVILEPGADREKDDPDQEPVVREGVRFLPVRPEGPEGGWSHPLALMVPHRRSSSGWQELPAGTGEDAPAPAVRWMLTAAGFEQWAAGGCPDPKQLVGTAGLWRDEVRTGVGLETQARSSRQGQLYTFGLIRLAHDVALGLELRGGSGGLEPGSLVHLGGERRVAELGTGPALPVPGLDPGGEAPSWVVVSMATPCLSPAGAFPPGFAPDRLQAAVCGVELRLVGAVVLGSVPVGGWDLARGRPKPMRRAIPAGSTFYFEVVGPDGARDAARQVHGRCLATGPDMALAQQGFGLALAGIAG